MTHEAWEEVVYDNAVMWFLHGHRYYDTPHKVTVVQPMNEPVRLYMELPRGTTKEALERLLEDVEELTGTTSLSPSVPPTTASPD